MITSKVPYHSLGGYSHWERWSHTRLNIKIKKKKGIIIVCAVLTKEDKKEEYTFEPILEKI
jgi:hypothetical protein